VRRPTPRGLSNLRTHQASSLRSMALEWHLEPTAPRSQRIVITSQSREADSSFSHPFTRSFSFSCFIQGTTSLTTCLKWRRSTKHGKQMHLNSWDSALSVCVCVCVCVCVRARARACTRAPVCRRRGRSGGVVATSAWNQVRVSDTQNPFVYIGGSRSSALYKIFP
jgi:hypothetical protein